MRRIPLLHDCTFAVGSAIAVFVANAVLLDRGYAAGDYVALAYFALYGAYCTANYFSCREVHCAVTGPGFLVAALLMGLRIFHLAYFGYTLPYLVFWGVAVAGHMIERGYARRTGSRFGGGTQQ